jgi:outer membrane protein OmpA-like peptidoglycan-associated protein
MMRIGKRSSWMTILALVTVLLVAAGPASAGGEKGNVELGVYLGRVWLDDYSIFQPDDDMVFGGRLGYWMSNHWNLELSHQRLKTDTEFGPTGPPDVDMRIVSTRLNLVHNFAAGSSFRPFLTVGGGLEKSDIKTYTEDSDFGWNAGGGFRIFLSRKFNLRLDGRYVRTKVGDVIDDSQGNVEATAGLGLLFGGHKEEVAEVPVVAPPPNQPPTVSCVAERAEILPGESVRISATGADPENGPLTYEWTATAGRVTGSGAGATLDFTGATPPATAAITVRVTDDHGLTATSDCSVRLIEPAKPAEAVSCTAGGFPRNLSRLSNVDKACLDDVAQRLTADPRARVIVIGHADTRERTATVAQQRADAVRDYLVKERSIDPARVTTRSAGKTKPLETGTDAASQTRNRRVEIWFVPEGATVPE